MAVFTADDFGRSDRSLDGDTPSTGSYPWALGAGSGCSIVSGQAVGDSAGLDIEIISGIKVQNVDATVSVVGTGTKPGVVARYVDSSNYYFVALNASDVGQLFKTVGGSNTQIGTNHGTSFSPGDALGISVSGTTISLTRNGTPSATATGTDSAFINPGYVGIRIGTASAALDNFSANETGGSVWITDAGVGPNTIEKPALWTPGVNTRHPLFAGLRRLLILNEGDGTLIWDAVQGEKYTCTGTIPWSVGSHGPELAPAAGYLVPTNLYTVGVGEPYSVAMLHTITGSLVVNTLGATTSSGTYQWYQTADTYYIRPRGTVRTQTGAVIALGTEFLRGHSKSAAGNYYAYQDGKYLGNFSGATDTGAETIGIIGARGDAAAAMTGRITFFAIWNRVLTAGEWALLAQDPFALGRPLDRLPLWVGATSGGTPPVSSTIPVFVHHYQQLAGNAR